VERIRKRFFCSQSKGTGEPGTGTSQPIGSIFDLTPEQYAELKENRVPLDHQYTTYTSEPNLEEDPIFEPKYLDLTSMTELMAKKKFSAAAKRANELLEPHAEVIQRGYPSHDPTILAELRNEIGECLSLLSSCYLNMNKLDLAIEAVNSATVVNPTSGNFSELASYLLDAERYEEAITAAERSIELDPHQEVEALVTKAYALWKLEKWDRDILGLCDLALARDPYATTALEIKAHVYAHSGNYKDALKAVDRAIAKDDSFFHLVQLKSALLLQNNQPEIALTSVLRFFKQEPDCIEAHQEAAKLAIIVSNWKLAIEHLKVVTEQLDIGYADLASAAIHEGHLDLASKSLETAIERDNFSSIAMEQPYSASGLKRRLTIKRKNMEL
jgi:tetratricopeptide (TPR) repeat protein